MERKQYIDLMERVMSAYTEDHIRKYTQDVMDRGLWEHGYPRLTANLGFLIAHGKRTEWKELFCSMMDLCCDEFLTALKKNGGGVGNEFSVKEIVLCLLELEKAGTFDQTITDGWRVKLSKINPYETYSAIAPIPVAPVANWAAFCAASEQLRNFAHLGGETAFIDHQVKSQLFAFDENGMYRDPNEPMVYDFVTRLQLAVVLHFGFDGESRKELESQLLKSADITLRMQSVTGEIPFGGRSNQFLHNETFYAALCEFYATMFKTRGDMKKAGKFKNAARMAVESVCPWLYQDCIHHIKNYYPADSMFGCEEYAYFDKYMITTASWLILAYTMADDSIDEVACPAASDNYICVTSPYFHKVMCRYNDYFIEFDTNADAHYDSSGLGRIHKKGIPSALCLSVPFTKTPSYMLDIENPSSFSICTGLQTNHDGDNILELPTVYHLIEKYVSNEFVRVKFECQTENGYTIHTSYTVSDDGVEIQASGNGEIEILFPLFQFDGLEHTNISLTETSATVSYKGCTCYYETDGVLVDKQTVYANRNGHYRAATVKGQNSVSLKIEMTN